MRCVVKLALLMLLSFLFVWPLSSFGQPSEAWGWHDTAFINYTYTDGLPRGKITNIEQDSAGFFWLLTHNGLYRFDGYHFEHIPLQNGEDTLSIYTFTKTRSGRFILSTSIGLLDFDPFERRWLSLRWRNEEFEDVSLIDAEQTNDDIWFSHAQGVGRLSLQDSHLDVYMADVKRTYPSLRFFTSFTDQQETVWLATSHGLFFKTAQQADFQKLDLSPYINGQQRISAITALSNGDLWVATPHQGIVVITAKREVLDVSITGFKGEWIFSMSEISKGVVWLGTFGQGVIEVNALTGETRRITHNRLNDTSLVNNEIWRIAPSNDGLIWLATSNGVSVFNPNQTMIKNLLGDIGRKHGLFGIDVTSVSSTNKQDVWLGYRLTGVDIANNKEGVITHIPSNAKEDGVLPPDAIEALSISEDDRGYIGTSKGVYTFYNGDIQRVAPFTRDINAYTGALLLSDSTLWAGGTDGLWRFSLLNDGYTLASEKHISNTLSDVKIATLAKWGVDGVIVGTWNGINWVNANGDVVAQMSEVSLGDAHVSLGFVSSLLIDAQQRLWVGTEGQGLFVSEPLRLPQETRAGIENTGVEKHPLFPQSFIRITEEDGLADNIIRGIEVGAFGKIWVSSSEGISVVDNISFHPTSIMRSDIRLTVPYSRNATAAMSGGILVFGGAGGATVIDTTKAFEQHRAKPVLFTTSKIGSRLFNSPMAGENSASALVVPASNNKVSVSFTSLDYVDAKSRRYRYRLVGFEQQWNLTNSNNRVASYTRLAPGDYSLEVQSTLAGNPWQGTPSVMHLHVQPHWYQTWWAQMAFVLAGIATIVGLIFVRTLHLKRREAYLVEQVNHRTKSLEVTAQRLKEKSEQLLKLSHIDPLTQTYNRRFIDDAMKKDSQLAIRRYQDSTGTQPLLDSDLMLFLIDIDHFKKVNDEYGHHAGDKVLVEIAKRLTSVARDTDYVVRWGGEEFLLVMRHASRQQSHLAAARLREVVASSSVSIDDVTHIPITCTIGSVPFPFNIHAPSATPWDEVLKVADHALYVGKAAGRDIWVDVAMDDQYCNSTNPFSKGVPPLSMLCLRSNRNEDILRQLWLVTHQDFAS
jgi:diguanylate cyclase (GGDEF)-like protein